MKEIPMSQVEDKVSPNSSEKESVIKSILRELGDLKTAKNFGFHQKFRGIDTLLECKGDRSDFTIELTRFFNKDRVRYIFQNGQFAQVALTVDASPKTPFSHRQEIHLHPSEIAVTEEMVLYLIRTVKQEDENFNKAE